MPDANESSRSDKLRRAAQSMRDLFKIYLKNREEDKEEPEQQAGEYLHTAIKLGAFSGAEYAELRHLVSLPVTEAMNSHQQPRSRVDALGTPIYRAVDWLLRKNKLPAWIGGRSDAWFPDAYHALADLIDTQSLNAITAPHIEGEAMLRPGQNQPTSEADYRAAKARHQHLLEEVEKAADLMTAANSRRKSADADAGFHGHQDWHNKPIAEHRAAAIAYEAACAQRDAFFATPPGRWFCTRPDLWEAIGGPSTIWQLGDFLQQWLNNWNELVGFAGGDVRIWDRREPATATEARAVESVTYRLGWALKALGPTPSLRELYEATQRLLVDLQDRIRMDGLKSPAPTHIEAACGDGSDKKDDQRLSVNDVVKMRDVDRSTVTRWCEQQQKSIGNPLGITRGSKGRWLIPKSAMLSLPAWPLLDSKARSKGPKAKERHECENCGNDFDGIAPRPPCPKCRSTSTLRVISKSVI